MLKNKSQTTGGVLLGLLITSIVFLSLPQNVKAQSNDSITVAPVAVEQIKDTIKTEVLGQLIPCCGSYFTSKDGEYKIKYTNTFLPWGVHVYFYYGFKEVSRTARVVDEDAALHWQKGGEIEMVSTAPFVWEVSILKQLTNRGFSTRLADLQFVFKIVDEQENISWERGNDSLMGYYQAIDLFQAADLFGGGSSSGKCSKDAGTDNFCRLYVTSIYKIK